MGVNTAALIHYRFRTTEEVLLPLGIPLSGLIVSAFIRLNLGRNVQLLGFAWIVIGLVICCLRRRSRLVKAPSFDEPAS